MHIAPTQYRNLTPDIKAQELMRFANSLFYFSRRITARKDEAQVTGSLRQGYKRIIYLSSNFDTGNQRHILSFFNAVYAFKYAGGRNGNHHYSRGMFIALNGGDFFAYGVTQD